MTESLLERAIRAAIDGHFRNEASQDDMILARFLLDCLNAWNQARMRMIIEHKIC